MRKLVVGTFVTLDGVMQAPGGPNDDREGAFKTQRGKRMKRSKKMSWLAVGIVALVGSIAGFANAASPASADEAAIRP